MINLHKLTKIQKKSGLPIQEQLKKIFLEMIRQDQLQPGEKLPSSRYLAQYLKISRNTVLIVYEALIDEGYLTSINKRGYFVSKELNYKSTASDQENLELDEMLSCRPSDYKNIDKPKKWREYKYPFINGQIDSQHFPSADWASCMKMVCRKHFVQDWNCDIFDMDDESLIDQLRYKILPSRDIWLSPEEIIITSGSQHALFMAAFVLLNSTKKIAIEDPGYVDFRNICKLFTEQIQPVPVDKDGMKIVPELNSCNSVYVTPSFQAATTVTMSQERREQLLKVAYDEKLMIIEDDYETDLNADNFIRPLKAMDNTGQVIYTGSLSKTIAPGLRMGFLAANKEIIKQIRALKRLNLRHSPLNNQRAVSLFISQGYYENYIKKIRKVFSEKHELIVKNIRCYLPDCEIFNEKFSGSSVWLKLPDDIDIDCLRTNAEKYQLYFEDGRAYFFQSATRQNNIKLGYASIKDELIEEGVKILAKSIHLSRRSVRPV